MFTAPHRDDEHHLSRSIASQARSLMNRLTRDLEAADVDTQHPQPAHGAAYIPVLVEITNALLGWGQISSAGMADMKPEHDAYTP
jgi:hypothetical protein